MFDITHRMPDSLIWLMEWRRFQYSWLLARKLVDYADFIYIESIILLTTIYKGFID